VRVDGELLAAAPVAGVVPSEQGSDGVRSAPLVAAILGPAGTPLRGYEIHMGRTTREPGVAPLLRLRGADGSAHDDGAVVGRICGSYVHGLFDQPELRTAFLNGLRATAGLAVSKSAATAPEADIDRLADHVEAHLDMRRLNRIVGLETA